MHGALWTPEKPDVHNAPIIEILENAELQTLLTTALWILGGRCGSQIKIQGEHIHPFKFTQFFVSEVLQSSVKVTRALPIFGTEKS